MNRLKQVSTAIALVASLGLVMPASFGGPALADIKPPPNDHVRNPQYVDTIFKCDLNGDAENGVEGDGYETEYELVSTFGARMWQDKNSNTIVVQRLRVDVIDSYYTIDDDDTTGDHDPTGTAVDFADPDVYWFDAQDYKNKPKGWKTVRCTEEVSYLYAPYLGEADPIPEEVGLYPAEFVQNTPDDSTPGSCPDEAPEGVDHREDLPECVTYTETDTNLYDVTLSPANGAVQVASADDAGTQSADRAQPSKSKHKNGGGKHRGKGKHRK